MKQYAIVFDPGRYGRTFWETCDSYAHAKYTAAFYRHTYKVVVEIWSIREDGQRGR